MSDKVPVDNDTRQIRWIASSITITFCTLILTLGGCEMYTQTNPSSSRCLPGTTHVEVENGWACAPEGKEAGQ